MAASVPEVADLGVAEAVAASPLVPVGVVVARRHLAGGAPSCW